jgi:hypothetical protein
MSNGKETISYANLVDLLRNHLRDGVSGLITGISEKQHSFQIGFEKGEIVFLTYRVFKSAAALDKLLLIDSAKIVEHLGVSPPSLQADLPDSGSIMARLAMGKSAAGSGELASANIASSAMSAPAPSPSAADNNQASTTAQTKIDVSKLDAIKRSAVHSFGPFGAMMCDKHLTPSSIANTDLRTLLMRIAQDLGASDADTKAFIGQIIR